MLLANNFDFFGLCFVCNMKTNRCTCLHDECKRNEEEVKEMFEKDFVNKVYFDFDTGYKYYD